MSWQVKKIWGTPNGKSIAGGIVCTGGANIKFTIWEGQSGPFVKLARSDAATDKAGNPIMETYTDRNGNSRSKRKYYNDVTTTGREATTALNQVVLAALEQQGLRQESGFTPDDDDIAFA